MSRHVEIASLLVCIARCEAAENKLFCGMLSLLGTLAVAAVGSHLVTPEASASWTRYATGCFLLIIFLAVAGGLLLHHAGRLRARLQHLLFVDEDEMMEHEQLAADRSNG
jgi:hypothetical protein